MGDRLTTTQLTATIQKRKKNIKQINLLKPTGHVMYQQFNIQQL